MATCDTHSKSANQPIRQSANQTIRQSLSSPALAIGFFDGVHRGHQAILAAAKATGRRVVAFTFRNHPRSIVSPAANPALIQTPDGRREKLLEFGANEVLMHDFTPQMAGESCESFAEFLRRRFGGGTAVFCGVDWRFGRGGAGRAETLGKLGFDVTTVPSVMDGGLAVSSTRIRASLAAGDVETANRLLGYPCQVRGKVAPGKGLGRKLGRPTINLSIEAPAMRLGVYAVEMPSGARGLANYGLAPTAGEAAWKTPVLEIHLLEPPQESDLRQAACKLLRFIRPERKFASFDELKSQIAKDMESAFARRAGE